MQLIKKKKQYASHVDSVELFGTQQKFASVLQQESYSKWLNYTVHPACMNKQKIREEWEKERDRENWKKGWYCVPAGKDIHDKEEEEDTYEDTRMRRKEDSSR